MNKYHKIKTVFKRNLETKFKTLIEGEFSLPEFGYLQYNQWVFTEKVDGTNIRVMFDGSEIKFGGKTDNAQIPTKLINRLNETFLPKIDIFKSMFSKNNSDIYRDETNVCLYGEGYGAKIQKGGGNYRLDQDFVLFDIKIGEWWLQRYSIEEIANGVGIDVVPIIGTGTLWDMVEITKSGFNSKWGNFIAEGIVGRPVVELKSRNGNRIITKVKYKDFLR